MGSSPADNGRGVDDRWGGKAFAGPNHDRGVGDPNDDRGDGDLLPAGLHGGRRHARGVKQRIWASEHLGHRGW